MKERNQCWTMHKNRQHSLDNADAKFDEVNVVEEYRMEGRLEFRAGRFSDTVALPMSALGCWVAQHVEEAIAVDDAMGRGPCRSEEDL